jgi:inhibitor of KinA sporulation pathway (predicted exonuclease)
MAKSIIFYDTEFTTWEGAMENGWSLPGQYRELVQIGALRFDLETLTEGEEFLILARPRKNPVLSDYFIDLTGITNEDVAANGLDFPDAFSRFMDFVKDTPHACYGTDDAVVLENCTFHNMPDAPGIFDSFNIGPWFKTEGAKFGVQGKTNSGALAKTVGAPMSAIQEHNALHDARSIAAAYRFMVQNGVKSPF